MSRHIGRRSVNPLRLEGGGGGANLAVQRASGTVIARHDTASLDNFLTTGNHPLARNGWKVCTRGLVKHADRVQRSTGSGSDQIFKLDPVTLVIVGDVDRQSDVREHQSLASVSVTGLRLDS